MKRATDSSKSSPIREIIFWYVELFSSFLTRAARMSRLAFRSCCIFVKSVRPALLLFLPVAFHRAKRYSVAASANSSSWTKTKIKLGCGLQIGSSIQVFELTIRVFAANRRI